MAVKQDKSMFKYLLVMLNVVAILVIMPVATLVSFLYFNNIIIQFAIPLVFFTSLIASLYMFIFWATNKN